jgi:LmbE family N-acetylglucosaminyl deacetylase
VTILGIWAHPDDEVFVSGGLMANAVKRGERVACLHMTRGEAGLSFRRPCPPEILARIRENELETALARLGVGRPRFFGYPDGCLAEVDGEEATVRIHDAMVEIQPDVIVTFGPEGFTGHPDHQALSAWVTAALSMWDTPHARLYHAAISGEWLDSFVPALNEFDFFWPRHPVVSDHADVTLHLDDELLAAKIEALRKHASQMKPLFDSYGDGFMRALVAREHFALVPEPRQQFFARCRGMNEFAA